MTTTAVSYPDDPDDDARAPRDGDTPANQLVGKPGHDRAQLSEREAKALRLRRLGGTYDQIAVEMGFADASGARQLIMRALDRVVAENATHLRSLENARLDVNTQVLMGIATDAKNSAMERIRATEAYTRVSARRARLNGLDAPVQVAVSAGSLAELDDAIALFEAVVRGEVVESHDLAAEQQQPADGGPGGSTAGDDGTEGDD